MKDYFVYILKCSDDSYYTGVTNNLEKRINENQSGIIKGYTNSRLPIKLVFSERFSDINPPRETGQGLEQEEERSFDK